MPSSDEEGGTTLVVTEGEKKKTRKRKRENLSLSLTDVRQLPHQREPSMPYLLLSSFLK